MASCVSTTKDGERCKRVAEEGVCWQHKSQLLHKAKIIHSTAELDHKVSLAKPNYIHYEAFIFIIMNAIFG